MKVYLCGGINGLSDQECLDWRDTAKAMISGETLDPMRRDYRGTENNFVDQIVKGDLEDIEDCSAVLVNATRPSWGTAMEIVYAHQKGKLVSVFVGNSKVSPWLTYHVSHVAKTIDEAVEWLNSNEV